MSEDNTTKFSMSELVEKIGAKPAREQDRLNVELIDLRQFKKDALEMAAYYASTSTWKHTHCPYGCDGFIEKTDLWTPFSHAQGYVSPLGGKRAREFLSKYLEKKKKGGGE